ncbi:hypothetical protein BDV33DRAFT_197317 [Aspergillus novoparasiticus]|uniref:Uncharacterized protein n=1 Tax=Aspergillus novoparasiticus TaxID=986946 RepID=A0A5N6FBS7_9EURO|nr:hypothetical protein BDV33DRAFT_197317 [Aspergillus novoparasiticus]
MCARTYEIAVTKGDLSVSTSIPRYGRLFSYHYFYDPVDLKGEIANNSTDLCWTAGHEIPDTMNLVPTDTNPGLEPSIFKNVDEFAICPVQDIDLYVDRLLASTRNIEVYSSTGTTMSWSPSPSMKRVMTSGLDVVLKNIASSLTKYSLDFSNFTVNGAAKVPEVYVSVNWRFLSLPVAVLLLGFIFIVSTILISHKMKAPIWKSSLLPVLYHGLRGANIRGQYITISSMEQAAQSTHIQFETLTLYQS